MQPPQGPKKRHYMAEGQRNTQARSVALTEMLAMTGSPALPVTFGLLAVLSAWYSTRTDWIRRAAEKRVKWDNRIYRRTVVDVESNVELTRIICFVVAALSIAVVVLWVVQALLGNLE